MFELNRWRRYLIFTLLVLGVTIACGGYIVYSQYYGAELNLSAAEQRWIAQNGTTLIAAGDPDFAPVDFTEPNEEHAGMSEDMLRLVESKTGLKFRRIAQANNQAVLDALRDKKINLSFATAPTQARKAFMDFSNTYLSVPAMMLVKPSDTRMIRSEADLGGKTVAVTGSYATFDHFAHLTDQLKFKLIATASDEEALKLVSSGQVDVAICDLPTVSWLVDKQRIGKVAVAGPTSYVWQFSFGLHKDQAMLASILNKTLASLSSEEVKHIQNKWIGVEYRPAYYDTRLWITALGGLGLCAAVALVMLLWDRSLRNQVAIKTKELSEYKNGLEQLVVERTAELHAANERLSLLATTDTLTGALNWQAFMDESERQHAQYQRIQHAYTVIALDLDYFKQINDSYGHDVGDEVLVGVSSLIQQMLRNYDLFGRVGGEEFLMMLPETHAPQALELAERLRTTLSAARVSFTQPDLQVTASFGVCEVSVADESFASVRRKADQALYQAKASGRNLVMRYVELN